MRDDIRFWLTCLLILAAGIFVAAVVHSVVGSIESSSMIIHECNNDLGVGVFIYVRNEVRWMTVDEYERWCVGE